MLNMRQRRWVKLSSDYNCELKYHPGKENVVADALSRKEIFRPSRVRALGMLVQTSLISHILEAQREAIKEENLKEEALSGVNEKLEIGAYGIKYLNGRALSHLENFRAKVIENQSVGSPPSRVILFGDIPTVIPSTSVVALETSTIALVISSAAHVVETTLVASPTGLCGLVPYSDSDSNSPDEMSSPKHISPLPAISPFLCTDSSEAPDSSDGPPSQDPYVMAVARWRSKVASRPSSSSEFPIAPVTASPEIRRWKRVGPLPARRLAWRRASPRSSDHHPSSSSSSSDSSPVHSSGLDAPDQAHSGSSARDTTSESSSGCFIQERPLHSSSHLARPSQPAGEDSSDLSATRDDIVRSFEDMPIDLDDAPLLRNYLRLENFKVRAMLDIERDRVNSLRLHMSLLQEEFRQDTRLMVRTMTSTRSGMTPVAIKEMINQRVDAALEARRVNQDLKLGNRNDNGGGDGNGNGNGNGTGNGNNRGDNGDGNENRNVNRRGDRHVAREYGSEKMETVFHISNCPERYQVKYATCTLLDSALTWWTSHKRTIGTDAAYALSWRELLKLMTEVYCLRNEIQKMETELWNFSVKNNDMATYTQRFQELNMMCTKMVPEEEDRVEKFIGGLPIIYKGM
ncbi:putative reverse transcriptase domain-containing protein [Tanacetum coccineum]